MFISILLYLVLCGTTIASEAQGELRHETRNFKMDDDENTIDEQNAMFVEFIASGEKDNFEWKASFISRQDAVDYARDFMKPTDLYLGVKKDALNLKLGTQVLNFGSLDLFHGGDNFNARNFDSSPERFEKFGELGAYLSYSTDSFEFLAGALSKIDRPLMPSPMNRAGPLIAFPENEYVVKNNETATTFKETPGVFIGHYRGESLDVELSYLSIPDRNTPLLVVTEAGQSLNATMPMKQTGLGITYSIDEFLLKAEGFRKNYENLTMDTVTGINPILGVPIIEDVTLKDHTIQAFGIEYQKSFSNGHDGTLLLEYQGISDLEKDERKMYTLFQNDVGIAYRHNINDMNSQEITFLVFFDQDTQGEIFAQVHYQRRLDDHWKILGGWRVIDAEEKSDDVFDRENYLGMKPLREGDQVYTSLSYNF